ncbi:hypothetical protein VTN49DRAFT_4404 [Thermomyces lanuginosus]|uniref:uncharacterized protein n=1 Tax=Thermomyces lanuginosus TaxID=5541 RepID=UPI0037439F6D
MAQEKFYCRWAGLSLSNIAGVFFPDLLFQRDPSDPIQHELVAVSTTGTRERAESWLNEHKIPNANAITIYQSWEEMLEKGDFDIVYISTPHTLHYKHVRKALECKRNVLVEKPATMNRRQYEELIRLARQQGVVMMEAMWTRYLPATEYLQEQLLPRIGQVRRVYAEFSFPIVSADLEHSSRFLDKKAGAGSLLDQGVYALTWADLALHGLDNGANTTSEVVHAHTMNVPGVPGDVDDITTVVLASREKGSNEQSAVGIITTSMTLPGSNKPPFYRRLQANRSSPAVRIEGTKASVAVSFPPIRPQELHVQWYGNDCVNEDGTEREEIIHKPVKGWGIWYQADVIAKQVLQTRKTRGPGVVIGAEESLRVLSFMDKARELAGIQYDSTLEEV